MKAALWDEALANTAFRHVLATGESLQVVLMSLPPGETIGHETHPTDQLLIVAGGEARFRVAEQEGSLKMGDSLFVPGGVAHNVQAAGEKELQLISVYAPPEHALDTHEGTKEEAEQHSDRLNPWMKRLPG
jgi:quercetin dioxygenase-like cupin family protein